MAIVKIESRARDPFSTRGAESSPEYGVVVLWSTGVGRAVRRVS